MSEAWLDVQVRHRLGSLKLDVAFRAATGWTVLFGASGSGKSTVLRAIAGLVRPEAGRVAVRGRVLTDTASGLFVPAHQRGVRWAGQTAMLFPRMTVRENLRCGGENAEQVECAITHFRLQGLMERMPGQLSGGERQRVAVVGAALAKGHPLLLDEPFTGLDGDRREELIALLREWKRDTPVVSVTHDVGEAFLLGAEVVRIREGRVVAQGPVEEVLAEERERLKAVLGSQR